MSTTVSDRRSPEAQATALLTRYLALCDVPRPPHAIERLEDLFAPDAVWEGVGPRYAATFGRTTGADAIAAMLSDHLPPNGDFAANVHLLTPGTVDVDGAEVRGRWLMLQMSRFLAGAADVAVARLNVHFRITGEQAHITQFRTERVFDLAPTAGQGQGVTR